MIQLEELQLRHKQCRWTQPASKNLEHIAISLNSEQCTCTIDSSFKMTKNINRKPLKMRNK